MRTVQFWVIIMKYMFRTAEKFVIGGGRPLEGEIEVRGAKNAAASILPAVLLTDQECVIDNIPLVQDVLNLIDILKSLGAQVEWLDTRKIKISPGAKIDVAAMDFKKASAIRMSVLLIGALLPRINHFKIAKPGGDRIGLRPISTHIEALRKLGVSIEQEGSFYKISSDNMQGKEIVLREFSVTATENLMMASTLISGKTIIKGAAAEPHIQNLGEMLNKMGAKIAGLGTHTIIIEGVKKLGGVSHSVIPDPNEAGTFIMAGAITPGQVRVKGAISTHMDVFIDKLEEIGINLKKEEEAIIVDYSPELNPVRVQALPYPGFPTDLLPPLVPLLTQAKGKSLVHDPLYENRLSYTHELRKMGADIEMVDPHRAIVFGKTELTGQRIESGDIRAGAALIIAGLMAKGNTTIENIHQIDRGYEKIEERLQGLGADIKRTE